MTEPKAKTTTKSKAAAKSEEPVVEETIVEEEVEFDPITSDIRDLNERMGVPFTDNEAEPLVVEEDPDAEPHVDDITTIASRSFDDQEGTGDAEAADAKAAETADAKAPEDAETGKTV